MSLAETPVPFTHPLPITQETADTVGSKGSYVTALNGHVALVMLPAGDAVVVPSAYEKPLRVLSYRFELQKCTIPRMMGCKRACKTLLHELLYLDRLRDRFVEEAGAVPVHDGFQYWRCVAFDYHLWLDYLYAKHDDNSRKLLESEHGVTFKEIACKKPGTDILKILNWETYKRRHCQQIDLCGFDYPLEKHIGKGEPPDATTWARFLLTGVRSDRGALTVRRRWHNDPSAFEMTQTRMEMEANEERAWEDKGKRKMEVVMESEVLRGQRIVGKATSSGCQSALENLQMLLHKVPGMNSDIPNNKQSDELRGLHLFMDALNNYPEKPNSLRDFFQLSGTADRVREDIQRAKSPIPAMKPSDGSEGYSSAMRQPTSSKQKLTLPPTRILHGQASESPTPNPYASQCINEDLFKAWRRYKKP